MPVPPEIRTFCSAAIALAIDLVIHIDRKAGRRVVTEALKVSGYDARTDQFEIEAVSGV